MCNVHVIYENRKTCFRENSKYRPNALTLVMVSDPS